MIIYAIVPTYNESENAPLLVEALFSESLTRALEPHILHVVVVDDSSPDHTIEALRPLLSHFPRLHLLCRTQDRGRGSAGRVGFDYAITQRAEVILEMDADFSHPPELIPALVAPIGSRVADITIASRFHAESRDTRPMRRRVISWLANAYIRLLLARPSHASSVGDWTTGFRAYRAALFEGGAVRRFQARDPSVLQETLLSLLNRGARAQEVPFQMNDRVRGKSTFTWKTAARSLTRVLSYWIRDVLKRPESNASWPYRYENLAQRDIRVLGQEAQK